MIEISTIGAVRSIVEMLMAAGVEDVVLSPGSRNAPIILSLSAIPEFNCISVVDERTAAFMALGMAQQSGKPVAICCTSGSAMLNYAPAISEAYYQRIPLIMITADRPVEWIDQGEGQSIRQLDVLNGVLGASTSLIEELGAAEGEANRGELLRVLGVSTNENIPVQINVPLSEPLYEFGSWEKPAAVRWVESIAEPIDHSEFQSIWARSQRILVLVAQQNQPSSVQHWLSKCANDNRVVVVSETTSNIYKLDYVSCIDRTLEGFLGTDREGDFIPDFLITIGDNVISKKVKALFRRNSDRITAHWHFGLAKRNTFSCLTNWVNTAATSHFPEFPERMESTSNFGALWKGQFFRAEERHVEFLANAPYSDLKVFEHILDFVPIDAIFQMGNSSVVRYIQLFNQLQGVSYFGNRGVSGIEGCTSTAVGCALKTDKPVLFVSGDHAFRYDANGLSFEELPDNLMIIVINNDGGNIFRIIDGPQKHTSSDKFIEHTQKKSVKMLVEFHGVGYSQANDVETLDRELHRLFDGSCSGPHVLEVYTPRTINPNILKDYFQFVGQV